MPSVPTGRLRRPRRPASRSLAVAVVRAATSSAGEEGAMAGAASSAEAEAAAVGVAQAAGEGAGARQARGGAGEPQQAEGAGHCRGPHGRGTHRCGER